MLASVELASVEVVIEESEATVVVLSAAASVAVVTATVVVQSGVEPFAASEQSVQPVGAPGAVQATPSVDGTLERLIAKRLQTRKIVHDLMMLQSIDDFRMILYHEDCTVFIPSIDSPCCLLSFGRTRIFAICLRRCI